MPGVAAQTNRILDSSSNRPAVVDLFGALKTSSPVKIFGDNFSGTSLVAQYWTSTLANGGTAPVASGVLTLRTNSTANGSSIVTAAKNARHVSGSTSCFFAQVRFDTLGTANNIRRIGAFDANNGAFFEINGTALNIVVRKGASDVTTASADFNGESAFIDNTGNHVYEIYFAEDIVIFLQDRLVIHQVNSNSVTWTNTYNLPIRFENTNVNNATTDVQMIVRGASMMRFGCETSVPLFYNTVANETRTLKEIAGRLHKVIVNKPGANSTVAIYDNTAGSGTLVATIDTTIAGEREFNCEVGSGLTYISAGQTAADVTFLYD